MEENKDICAMLELMILPAFAVRGHRIFQVNQAARELQILPDTQIHQLLASGAEEYENFDGGCLYLQLSLNDQNLGASVTRTGDLDIFLIEPDTEDEVLRAMALASRELRQPLGSLIAITENLLPRVLPKEEDSTASELLARMSRELYQMQRILGNMADAGQAPSLFHPEHRNLSQVFDDIFEKAGTLLSFAGMHLCYTGLKTDVYGMIDAQLMERGVLNILSNAMKYSQPGSQIQVSLTQWSNSLRLSILNSDSGMGDGVFGSLFSRYLRQPGLEDPRQGIGLGMVLIRAAAASHGGAVLVDRPSASDTRVTLTMKIRNSSGAHVHSPVMDLTGGRDQALIELSQFLPPSVYQKEL